MGVFLQGESINIEESLETVGCHVPFIAAFGLTTDELTDIKLVIEKENILQMPSIVMVLCCFAS